MSPKHRFYTSFDDTPDRLVRLLKSHRPQFISGEDLSNSLQISRTAVWKNVKKLRSLGYKIRSRPKSGYRLDSKTSLLLPWEITDGLQTETIGRKVYYFETIDSTQNFALSLASKPHENGSVVIAERQTRGRGRQNRKWVSPKGGIWLSILLKPNFEISQASLFPMLTSLALSLAIEKTLGLEPELRWPNDVTLNNKKVAGILVDGSIESNKIEYLVIGVGINFRVSPKYISKKITAESYGVATLVGRDHVASPVDFLQSFLVELEKFYNRMVSNEVVGIKKEWEKRSSTIGRTVKVLTPTGQIAGRAVGISDDGSLRIRTRGKIKKVAVGDIYRQSSMGR